MNNEQTANTIQFLQDTWSQKPMTPRTAAIWGAELARFEAEDVERALLQLARTQEWRPSLATIIKAIAGPSKEQPSAAFASVFAVLVHPPGERYQRLTPATAEAVRRLGGWSAVGLWKQEERHFRERDFARVYSEVCDALEANALLELNTAKTTPIASGLTVRLLGPKKEDS